MGMVLERKLNGGCMDMPIINKILYRTYIFYNNRSAIAKKLAKSCILEQL